MSDNNAQITQPHITRAEAQGVRYAAELEGHVRWLDAITGAALGVLATASGIYTYLGVSSLLDDNGALSFFAAASYSIAVSVGIFVFWSYLMRLLPSVRSMASRIGLLVSMGIGSLAIIAMSSWLNAAALAGSAAVEQHLAKTVQDYQGSLEQANLIAVSAQGLERDVARVRQSFEDLSAQEASGDLSGLAGRGAVFRVLSQKADELSGLEAQIASQQPLVDAAFAEGNATLSRMRALTVAPGPVEPRSVHFSEEAVRLAGLITQLRQLSVAPLVSRAAQDLAASVVLPELDGRSDAARGDQQHDHLGAGRAGPEGQHAAQRSRCGRCHAAARRHHLYADLDCRCGDPLCGQFCALMGRGHRDRPLACRAGIHPDGDAGGHPVGS
jgi:hypothetical protein